MPILNRDFGFSYYAVPKAACTSVKLMIFEIENGFTFRPFRINGVKKHIHTLYESSDFEANSKAELEGNFRFAVVRDPVSRLLSAYTNRVLYHDELSRSRLTNLGADLPPRPDLKTFVMRLNDYQAVSGPIRHHTLPMTYFLGKDPAYFHRLYRMNELTALEGWLRERTNLDVHLRHEQKSSTKITSADVSPSLIERIRECFSLDYEVFGSTLSGS